MEHAPSAGGIIARQESRDASEVKIYEYEVKKRMAGNHTSVTSL
jgi:hypothetical protein